MDSSSPLRLRVPAPRLEALSMCETTAQSLAAWVGALPMASTANAAKLVDDCVVEVSTLQTTASVRMELLEVLRPPVHYLAARLDRAAQTQNQHADELARAAQHLQAELCEGYLAVVRDLQDEQAAHRTLQRDLLGKAIHRAISDLSRQLLRTLQLYVQPRPEIWLTLNQLYLLAEQTKLTAQRLLDPENHQGLALSISDVYLRQVLLSCCKPNQLRNRNLGRIFNALEHWVSRVFIEPSQSEAPFCIDLASDYGPRYSSLNTPMEDPRSIRTDVLVYELEAYLRDIDSTIPIPEFIDNELLSQLVGAWGKITERSYRRLPSQASLMVCLGLRNVHFFLSGGVVFSDQIIGTDALLRREVNPFLDGGVINTPRNSMQPRKDVWEDAFDLRVRIPENPNVSNPESILLPASGPASATAPVVTEGQAESDTTSLYRYHRAQALDTSPGGYRLQWSDRLPPNLQAGELLAVREESDSRWCIAVVRWIQQDAEGATTGIELIAPRAIPVAARVVQKRGGPTDYARALLLPEIKAINQDAMLITPKLPFAVEQKIHLQRQGIQNTAQLRKTVEATESFNQFTFRLLDGYLENTGTRISMDALAGMVIDSGRTANDR